MANSSPAKLPRILLVNDDGIDAPGIQALRLALEPIADLMVVAPLTERSGAGCGLSLNEEMAVVIRRQDGVIWGYAVDGTPADCVKFALTALDGYRPDLVLSGINRGWNVGNSVWYSGTVAGALEATMYGLRAMAISLAAYMEPQRHFDSAAQITRALVPWLLAQTWKPRSFWNLNVPNLPFQRIHGIQFAHLGTAFFVDDFQLSRQEEDTLYYRNVGSHMNRSPEPENSDDLVVDSCHAALAMLSMDLTVDLPAAASQALEREWNQLAFGRPPLADPGSK